MASVRTSVPTSRVAIVCAVLVVVLAIAVTLAMLVGPGDLHDRELRDVLLRLRGHRLAAGLLTGAALAVGGVIMQGLFRNPLADPSIIGTTAGASLGGQVALALYEGALAGALTRTWLRAEVLVPLGALIGALGALFAVLAIARRQDDRVLLLLAGFVLSSLFLGVGNFLLSIAQESWELGRAMVAFVMGGLSGTGGAQVRMAAPLVLIGLTAAWFWGRPLDLLLSGEEEGAALGVNVAAVRRWAIVWVAVLAGAAVSLGGNLGFVGLVVPHALRPFVGWEHRALVPTAALGGGAFVALCDVIARIAPVRTELPLGVVTSLIGAPLFLWLLLRQEPARA